VFSDTDTLFWRSAGGTKAITRQECGAAEVGWQEAIDGIAGFGEGARGVFANVFGAQCEEDHEESAPGHDHFA